MMHTLEIQQQRCGNGTLVAVLRGKLSLETVKGFLEETRPLPVEKLVLDMSAVSFMDSAGVGALVNLFVHRRTHVQSFALAALAPQGQAVLQVAGLMKLLPVFSTVDEAVL